MTEKSDLLYNVRDCKADAFAESKRKEVKADEKNVQSTAGAGDSPDSGLRYSAADCFCGRAYRRRRHCAQLRDALGDPQIKVINLTDSFVVQEGAAGTNAGIFELDRAGVLLNGNGHTITVAGQGARAGHLLNVTADRVQINDLIVDGGGLVKHGINVWNAAGVTLGDVVSRNNLGTGLTVSGAEVAVMGRLSTSGNRWGGVNVGSGTGTSVAPKLTFLPGAGYSTQNEINGIYVDAAEAEKTGDYIFGIPSKIVNVNGIRYGFAGPQAELQEDISGTTATAFDGNAVLWNKAGTAAGDGAGPGTDCPAARCGVRTDCTGGGKE